MRKGVKITLVCLVGVLVVALFHTALHVLAYGTGIPGFAESGIVGFSVGEFDIGESIENFYPTGSSFSMIFVFIEWVTVISLFTILYINQRIEERMEYAELSSRMKIKFDNHKARTELDDLYEILKEKKKVRISTIAKVFNVDKNVVLEWARTLEEGNLASVYYPRFGSPQIVLQGYIEEAK